MENSLTGFSLGEIFEMLAANKKTGILTVDSGQKRSGKVWLRGGRLCRAETPAIRSDEESGDTCREQIKENISDGLLEILAWSESVYRFKVTKLTEEKTAISFDVKAILDDVARRNAEWGRIKKEIPSLQARVELIAQIDTELVNLTREQWSLIAHIGKSDIVEDLRKELNISPLAICRALLDMSKKGLIRCLGEVKQENIDSPAPRAEPEEKAVNKKYIRKSIVASDEAGNVVPAEWVSYYQLLDSRRAAIGDKVAKN